MKDPILITGIERSGSTIIAKVISYCGAFSGNVTEMQENRAIKNLVDSFYVHQLGIPSNGQNPLPNTKTLLIPPYWGRQVNDLIIREQYKEQIPWMYKNARIAQIWPIWNGSYPNAKWVIVRRRTPDIVQSCLKTGFMKAFNRSEDWLCWVKVQEELFSEMVSAGINYKEVWPERMVKGDFTQMQELIEWLGLEWNEAIPNLVKPLLQNSPQKERSI